MSDVYRLNSMSDRRQPWSTPDCNWCVVDIWFLKVVYALSFFYVVYYKFEDGGWSGCSSVPMVVESFIHVECYNDCVCLLMQGFS